jgi:uncharacterized protein
MTRDEAIARLRLHAPALRAQGVRAMALFGSTARNEAGPGSDIDILLDIDFEARPLFSLIDLAAIQLSLQDDLGVPVHPLISRGLRPRLRASIERDLVSVG